MASSSKVLFKLETLKEKALESIDFRIAQKRLEVESYDDDAVLEQRIADWRTRQEERISDLFRKLGEGGLDNHTLSKFKLDDIPKVDRWERERAETDLRGLESRRSKIVAKSESLVPDEDGNISLTKLQLREFFDL